MRSFLRRLGVCGAAVDEDDAGFLFVAPLQRVDGHPFDFNGSAVDSKFKMRFQHF